MLNFEQGLSETATPTPVDDENAPAGDFDTEPTEPDTVQETPTSVAARMLELAAVTADRLVTDAETEAESLVTVAQARADAILEASRNEAGQVAAELARTKEEQAAELDRERATALAELADEKAALEAQIATLRQMESDHRSQMRHHLTEQLSCSMQPCPRRPLSSPADAGEAARARAFKLSPRNPLVGVLPCGVRRSRVRYSPRVGAVKRSGSAPMIEHALSAPEGSGAFGVGGSLPRAFWLALCSRCQ